MFFSDTHKQLEIEKPVWFHVFKLNIEYLSTVAWHYQTSK